MLSAMKRAAIVEQLQHKDAFDVLIIGGGITGAGIALDAAKRGMRVALVEMQDFAAGTSSRSTKLVHGGLRYLKQLQIKVVSDSGKERAIVYENGPHVTTPEWMLLPMHKGGTFGMFSTSIGLKVYDTLAGVKPNERRKMLTRIETLQKAPLVKADGLKGGGYYVEYRTDDARLTIEVIKKAVAFGAVVLNYTKATQFIYDDQKKITGAEVVDGLSDAPFSIQAKKVINAAGPWVDEVRQQDYSHNNKHLRLTKGIHLVFDQADFPLKQAVYFDTKSDKRMIFAVPRQGKTYVGTTDTVFNQDKTNPLVTKEDRDYILAAINYMFPDVKMTADKIESSWAGVRPLIWEEGKDPSEISRKDEIWENESGLLTIAGGKLTGYRHMAQEIVDLVAKRLHSEHEQNFKPCATIHEPISGGDFGGSEAFACFVEKKALEAVDFGLDKAQGRYLATFYGTNVDQLFALIETNGTAKPDDLPLDVYARLLYGIAHELVTTPCDFFIRRTGALFFNIAWVREHKKAVINFMRQQLDWSDEVTNSYTNQLEKALYEAINFNSVKAQD